MKKIATRALALVVLVSFNSAAARADGVKVDQDTATQLFSVSLENASIAEVLRTIHEKYGVEIQGLEDLTATEPFTAQFNGKLPEILNRLLRNENFSMTRSDANPTGVVKVLIAGLKSNTNKSSDPSRPASNSAAPAKE